MKLRSAATRSWYDRAPGAVPRWAAISRARPFLDPAASPEWSRWWCVISDELDVLERVPCAAELLLERRERLVVRRAGVDERQRLAQEQPDVDRAEVRNRHRDLGDITHTRTERLTAPSAGAIV